MSSPLSALREILAPHVSAINAGVVIERSRRVLRDVNHLRPEDREGFFFSVSTTLRLFTSDERIAAIITALEQRLVATPAPPQQELMRFEMRDENDLRTARASARTTCLALAASATEAQRVATAVSELGRNIITYTPGGRSILRSDAVPPCASVWSPAIAEPASRSLKRCWLAATAARPDSVAGFRASSA